MKEFRQYTAYALIFGLLLTLGLYSCASIGSPSGGARDEDPPRFASSRPAPYSTGFRGDRLEIGFNELVSVRDAFTAVSVSPPVIPAPKVSASGRRIIVEFEDTLRSNTTYTIDFGKSIEDVNESNKLSGFSFTFSTGEELDTLQIAGVVLDAATLEPQQGVLVGAYTNLHDSAFRKLPMERVTKTDDRGRFVLRSLKALPYRVVTLADQSNDYRWDNPAEILGFYPEPITPYTDTTVASDTIFNMLTGEADTVVERTRTLFLPNNILLSSFSTGYKPQYLVDHQRVDSTRINLIFNTRMAAPVRPRLISPAREGDDWYLLERNAGNDTLSFYLRPEIAAIDTLMLELTYPRTEGMEATTEMVTDSLSFITKRPKAGKPRKRSRKQIEADSIAALNAQFIDLKAVTSTTQEIYAPAVIEFSEPLRRLDPKGLRVETFEDSLWLEVPGVSIEPDSLIARRLRLNVPWDYDRQYRIVVDSVAAQGETGRGNRTFIFTTRTRTRSGYSSLRLRIKPDTVRGFVEVLDASDKPVWKQTVDSTGQVAIPYLIPQEYYLRFTADTNGDGIFTPGDYDKGLQPEEVYYYPKAMDLRRFDRNEEWDLNATAVDMQKPDRIKKNKPETPRRPSTRKKKGDRNQNTEENEDDDYFDVNRNPFDPNYRRSTSTSGSY